MKVCDQCEAPVLEYSSQCPHCGGMLMRGPPAAESRSQPVIFKVLKWLLIGLPIALVVAAVVGAIAVLWILNSLGPMPSFG